MDPVLHIVMDKKTIAAALAPVLKDADAEGAKMLTRLGQAAVRMLSTMDRNAGHPFLAKQWAASAVEHDDNGYHLEVYSKAEDETIYNRSGNPGSRFYRAAKTPWSLKGRDLIAMLEYGTEPHAIRPRARRWRNGRPARLIFEGLFDLEGDESPVPVSDFLGTARTKRGVEIGIADNREWAFPETVVTTAVDHPGHPGFRFLEATKQELERGLQGEIDSFERGLSIRLS